MNDLELIDTKQVEKHLRTMEETVEKRIKTREELLKNNEDVREKTIIHTGRILHIDGDKKYSEKSNIYYKKVGLNAIVKNIPERKQPAFVGSLVRKYRPEILVITGHDGMIKKGKNFTDIYNYRNSSYFIKAVETIAPKMVVMENVRGMYKVSGQVLEDFAMIRAQKNGKVYSYQAARKMLNSQYFSVAQSRERLIYVAIRDDVISNKGISPERIFDEIDDYCEGRKQFTLQDALNDIKPLDAPRVKNTNEIDSESTGKKIDVNYYDNNCNDYLTLINQGRKIPFVFNHKARYVSDINYDIYRLLEPGDDATDPKIADIMPYAHRNHCFKDKYYKLRADRPCRTITAHLRMDCHSHIHPYQIRAITPREAARVQSFPDDYLFWGAYLKTYMQIGNAVPPVMARGIAYVLKKYL